jgi:uncharacterized protein (AIM24 family)
MAEEKKQDDLMRKVLSTFIILFFLTSLIGHLYAQTNKKIPPKFEWVKKAGGSRYDHAHDVVTDSQDNIYITGFFEREADFGEAIISSSKGGYDIFIAKMDKQGTMVWVKQAGGKNNDEGKSIAVDDEDNLYITGHFMSQATFGTRKLSSRGKRDIFIAKYDSKGDLLWVNQAGGLGEDRGNGITTDKSNNIIITGAFVGEAKFGGRSLNSSGGSDIFVAKYNGEGRLLWVKQMGGNSYDLGYAVSVDQRKNLYVTGYFKGKATVDGLSLISNGDRDIFVAHYYSNGEMGWVKKAGGPFWDYGYSIVADEMEGVYVTGFFFDKAVFGRRSLVASDQNDVFLAKYSNKGHLIWVEQAGGTSYDRGKSIAIDRRGGVYLSGHFKTETKFGEVRLTAHGLYDLFIAKYDTNGIFQWLNHAGGNGYDDGSAITLNREGNIIIAGSYSAYRQPAFFDDIVLESQYFDIFVGTLNQNQREELN